MATFYATIEGNRLAKNATGSRVSGIRAAAQSYSGSVIATLNYHEVNGKDVLMVRVGTNDHSSCYTDNIDFVGTYDEFNDLLKLASDIKNGRATVVRHIAGSGASKRAVAKVMK